MTSFVSNMLLCNVVFLLQSQAEKATRGCLSSSGPSSSSLWVSSPYSSSSGSARDVFVSTINPSDILVSKVSFKISRCTFSVPSSLPNYKTPLSFWQLSPHYQRWKVMTNTDGQRQSYWEPAVAGGWPGSGDGRPGAGDSTRRSGASSGP